MQQGSAAMQQEKTKADMEIGRLSYAQKGEEK